MSSPDDKLSEIYGLEHHMVEINGDVTMVTSKGTNRAYNATKLSSTLEAEFCNIKTTSKTTEEGDSKNLREINEEKRTKTTKNIARLAKLAFPEIGS